MFEGEKAVAACQGPFRTGGQMVGQWLDGKRARVGRWSWMQYERRRCSDPPIECGEVGRPSMTGLPLGMTSWCRSSIRLRGRFGMGLRLKFGRDIRTFWMDGERKPPTGERMRKAWWQVRRDKLLGRPRSHPLPLRNPPPGCRVRLRRINLLRMTTTFCSSRKVERCDGSSRGTG